MNISREFIEKMFEHYIERMRYKQNQPSSSMNCMWAAGEVAEAKLWLEQLGVDLSYARIQPMVDGMTEICAYDPGREPEEPWYTEEWYEDDLRLALEQNDLPDDEFYMETLKAASKDIFDDKSDRNEKLMEKACGLFPPITIPNMGLDDLANVVTNGKEDIYGVKFSDTEVPSGFRIIRANDIYELVRRWKKYCKANDIDENSVVSVHRFGEEED